MTQAKEITMTWDAATIEASLPRNSQFTFMDLLAMKGHAPVVVESRPNVAIAYQKALDAVSSTGRSIAGFIASLNQPGFDFMTLLIEKGHVPALAIEEEASTFSRLVHWANDNWKAPANNNARKAA
jgi:hypothetical protein